MTNPTAPRPSTGTTTAFPDGPWKSIIRIFAVVGAIMGLALIGNEILENISCPDGMVACEHIHLGTMLWGIALLSFCLLMLQKGDVSTSLTQIVSQGSIVRSWFTRSGRATDVPGTTVDTIVSAPPEEKKP